MLDGVNGPTALLVGGHPGRDRPHPTEERKARKRQDNGCRSHFGFPLWNRWADHSPGMGVNGSATGLDLTFKNPDLRMWAACLSTRSQIH